MANGWGGAREGAGRRPDDYEASSAEVELESQRARHEKIKADERELKLSILAGKHIPREAVRQASPAALAVLAQSLRAIPDNLERTLSLDPQVAEAIAEGIDAALAEVALALKAMSGDV